MRFVTIYLDTKEPGRRAKVSQLEVLAQVVLDMLNGCFRRSSNGDIVDEDGDNEANTISGIDIHRGVRFETSESKGFKCGMKLLVPKSTCLFETIKGLLKAKNFTLLCSIPALRHLHVDLCVQVTINEGLRDVQRVQL